MHVGDMRVAVPHPRVTVLVRMRLAGRVGRRMLVPMMLVVNVSVHVHERLVHVLVLVPLGQVQVDAGGHHRARGRKLRGERLAQ